MANQEITLFDLPTRPPVKAWSFNPWKVRIALNYKGLPYKTEWVEYPDIKPRFKDHLPPADLYTIPAVILPDGTWIMDSWKIADALEEKYPQPSLRLDSPYLARMKKILIEIMGKIVGIYVPGVHNNVLGEASQPYFRRTREEMVNMTLEQLEEKKGGEVGWAAAQPHLQEMTALLKENGDGPFFEGKTPGFADFVWVSLLIFIRTIGSVQFAGLLKATGDAEVHEKLLEATKVWTERDDH